MQHARLAAAFLAAVFVLSPAKARAEKSVIAVFDIYDARPKGKFSTQELQQWTMYLMAKLAEGQSYRVVPREQVVAAISGTKKDTYKACYDEQCQIELGKELAAEKSLGTQIIRIGDRCVITSTLYDLRTAVSERAATKRATCDQNAIADALDAVVDSLNKAQPNKTEVVDTTGDRGKKDDTEPFKVKPVVEQQKEEGAPPNYDDATVGFLETEDGRLCARGNGDLSGDACSRVADKNGSTRIALKHANRGCRIPHSNSCQWAAKIAYDLNEKSHANDYARYACMTLQDPAACSWYAKIEQEIGSKAKALEVASYNCTARQSSNNCAWAANIAYSTGNQTTCRDYANKGCKMNDAEACSWIVKLEYEAHNLDTAWPIAKKSCDE